MGQADNGLMAGSDRRMLNAVLIRAVSVFHMNAAVFNDYLVVAFVIADLYFAGLIQRISTINFAAYRNRNGST